MSQRTERTRTKDVRVGQQLQKNATKKTATIAKAVGTALDFFVSRTNKIAIYMAVKPVTMKK
jgi:hypothetical protein